MTSVDKLAIFCFCFFNLMTEIAPLFCFTETPRESLGGAPGEVYLWIFHSMLRQLIVFSSSKNNPFGINSKSMESGVDTTLLLMLQRNMLLKASLELRCFMTMMKLIIINNNCYKFVLLMVSLFPCILLNFN